MGLSEQEASRRAKEFLDQLGSRQAPPLPAVLDDAAIDVLHAACRMLLDSSHEQPSEVLERISSLHSFLEEATWPEPDFEERSELLASCAFAGWRSSRQRGIAAAKEWETRFAAATRKAGPVRFAADACLASINESDGDSSNPEFDDSQVLLAICLRLRDQTEGSPASVRDDAESFYRFLETPKRPIGLFDELHYFIGEAALLAGTACRLLRRREEAVGWFERSESSFRLTVNPVANWSRIAYQRLALRVEDRRFEELLGPLPGLIECFLKEGMAEEALKCRFLEGIALMETGELDSAAEVFKTIRAEATVLRNDRLVATACVNLVHVFGMLGKTEEALECSGEAGVFFEKSGNKIGLAKIQWGMGSLLRGRGEYAQAVNAYQEAQKQFLDLEMFADVAAANLVIADLLLEMGQETSALREILRALPIIDELKMVPEARAALSLLRESVRHQRINRQALRDLHAYFEDLK